MSSWTRRVALVYVTYWAATCTLQALWSGRIALSAENVVRWLVIPAIEVAALAGVAALWRRTMNARPVGGLAAFFGVWLVLTLVTIPSTLAVGIGVFHTIDATDRAIFAAVAVPALQASVLPSARQSRRWWILSVDLLAHPLVRPLLLIDAVMLSIGLVWWRHPQVGIALAPIQRHWIGTKFIAAAFFFAAQARHAASDGRQRLVPVAVLAVALAAVGLNAFTPWMLAATFHTPAPLSRQPLPLVWVEWFGAIFILVLLLVVRSRPGIARASAPAARLAAGAIILLFWALLALLTNASASLQPVLPWAPITVLAGSASATLFASAAILAAEPQPHRAH